jgi:hypothetical protein
MVAALAASLPLHAYQAPQAKSFSAAVETRVSVASLWNDRGSIESLNLFYGAGGKEHEPAGKFTFVKEDKSGASPKFVVVDDQGVHWKVKVGEEIKSETAATRLVWAAGYFTDEDYYLPELRVEKMAKLERGSRFVSADGVVRGVRMERMLKGQKKSGDWKWFKNPMVGTPQLNGLRTLMALLNNWDLKRSNNSIYEGPAGVRYVVSDLGATFGKTGGIGNRTKSQLHDYSTAKFIRETGPETVDLTLKTRPFFLLAIDFYHYRELASRAKVGKDIPREHVKWVGRLLGRLSPEQIRDCFRAAGYSPEEVEGFAKVVERRIAELNRL